MVCEGATAETSGSVWFDISLRKCDTSYANSIACKTGSTAFVSQLTSGFYERAWRAAFRVYLRHPLSPVGRAPTATLSSAGEVRGELLRLVFPAHLLPLTENQVTSCFAGCGDTSVRCTFSRREVAEPSRFLM